ncbi:MAG: hypothetical protein IKE66_10210 [Hyphomicrobium sp.]|nr:hypothetical protein [Hyphomicrobium sp.]
MSIEIDIAVAKVVAALEQQRLNDAAREALPFSKTMFSPDASSGLNSHLLTVVFAHKLPTILGSIRQEDAQWLRVAAGLHILGFDKASRRYLSEKVHTPFRHANDVTVRMTVFAANHQRRLQQFRETDVKKARVRGITENSCASCRAINGRVYDLRSLPMLPYEKCSCDMGCRCTVAAVLD